MTDEQILELVKEHFEEGGIQDDGSCNEWYGNTDSFLKFASKLYYQARYDGYHSGYDSGYRECSGGLRPSSPLW
jgi:hypothetical protein